MATGSAPKLRKTSRGPNPAGPANPGTRSSSGLGSSSGGWLSPLAKGAQKVRLGQGPDGFYANPIQTPSNRSAARHLAGEEQNVREPVAYGKSTRGHDPHIWASAKRGDVTVTVEHTEYIQDIRMTAAAVSSEEFADCLSSLDINPGQDLVFAWLGAMAGLFETYEFHKLEFIYNPAVGTDQDGKILMTFDPDILDEDPASKQKMLEARIQMDTNPYLGFSLKVPRDVLTVERYNRRGDVPAEGDPHAYDVGRLYIATPGVPAGMQGELFVKYKVVFRTPNGGTVLTGYGAATGESLTQPLGNSPFINLTGTLSIVRSGNTTFYINRVGTFKLTIQGAGTGFTSNCTITPSAPSTGVVVYGPGTGALGNFSTTAFFAEFVLTVYNNTDWTYANPSGAATITTVKWCIVPWEPDVISS